MFFCYQYSYYIQLYIIFCRAVLVNGSVAKVSLKQVAITGYHLLKYLFGIVGLKLASKKMSMRASYRLQL